ncbi:hypothetical protein MUP77_13595 [Candidatus Bathyarchaeota archaeon]|nr:hypothetical protein [Candidatus Bathyarchaeota archaeon]
MGKRITLYLTATELDMIEKICAKDGVGPNMSSTLKQGLVKMFENCFPLEGPEDPVPDVPSFVTQSEKKSILKKAVERDKSILKRISEEEKKELERLGISTE